MESLVSFSVDLTDAVLGDNGVRLIAPALFWRVSKMSGLEHAASQTLEETADPIA